MTLASMVKWYNNFFLFILLSFVTCPNALTLFCLKSWRHKGPEAQGITALCASETRQSSRRSPPADLPITERVVVRWRGKFSWPESVAEHYFTTYAYAKLMKIGLYPSYIVSSHQ